VFFGWLNIVSSIMRRNPLPGLQQLKKVFILKYLFSLPSQSKCWLLYLLNHLMYY